MTKRILIIIFATLFYVAWGQTYQFVRGSINSGSAHQTSTIYSSESSFAESVTGQSSSTDYNAYIGFLHTAIGEVNPVITNIYDVPHDQGHKVKIEWIQSALDDNTLECYYHVWSRNRNGGSWIKTDSLIATGENLYQFEAGTSTDSTQANPVVFDFKIVFHRAESLFESNIISGCSQDNIPPDIVQDVDIAISEISVDLHWEPVTYGSWDGTTYPELNGIWYKLYVGDHPDFNCNEESYLITTENENYSFDLTEISNNKRFFKIIVFDEP